MPSFVGTVQIEYLDHPEGATRDFLEFLSDNADKADWQLGTFHNIMVEYHRKNLLALVQDYVIKHSPNANQEVETQKWVGALPWEENNRYVTY